MVIYVASTAPYAGKTLTVLGLGQALSGKKLRYFKTLGNRPAPVKGTISDEDALLVAEALKLDQDPSTLCGLVLTQDVMVKALKEGLSGTKEEILAKARALENQAEILLASGFGTLYSGKFLGASNLELIKELAARVIVVVRFEGEFVVDYLLRAREELGERLKAVVINAIEEDVRPLYEDLVRPFLQREGFAILAEMPRDDILQAVSVAELRDFLGAQTLVAGREDRLVERFLIGGMQVDKAVTYFKKAPNFGVIVGGDRSDIQLAAIETGAVCLILTGGLYPNEIILAKAEEREVAVLVVPDDTYSTAQKVERLPLLTRLRHPKKLRRAFELTKRHFRKDVLEEILRG
ncbi:MAG: phosphotransacetylase family protein [Thermodesulfobacteria bacterium]|nr:phosphotransacetylase family protein [Thermodesulfobacteriota bacterium]